MKWKFAIYNIYQMQIDDGELTPSDGRYAHVADVFKDDLPVECMRHYWVENMVTGLSFRTDVCGENITLRLTDLPVALRPSRFDMIALDRIVLKAHESMDSFGDPDRFWDFFKSTYLPQLRSWVDTWDSRRAYAEHLMCREVQEIHKHAPGNSVSFVGLGHYDHRSDKRARGIAFAVLPEQLAERIGEGAKAITEERARGPGR